MADYLGELTGSMGEGLSLLLAPTTMLMLLVGIVIGLVIGILPGLGGLATMALLLLIPVVRTILLAVGSAELFALSLLGVLSIGVLTTESVTRGLLSGLIGLM